MTRGTHPPRSWIELLAVRAEEEAERRLYTFLSSGEEEAGLLTYRELDRQARAIGALLQANGGRGERALLLYPPGLEFIAAFFGALHGGAVAVPAYPPRAGRGQPRLRSIARDAAPRIVLTTGALAARAQILREEIPELGQALWLATDDLPPGLEEEWRDPGAGPETLAFLQYTSGSTADPKGVMVSHGNLLHNQEMIRRAFGQSRDSVVLGWLPLYHDMGLIGNVMQPLYLGARCILMSPMAFLQRPMRWLEAVSRHRATTSGGPNFAYELCVRKLGARGGEALDLDLSSWTLAFNGAEPVRAETLERFAAAFAPYGFDRRALYPCYGLAEATLFVSGGAAGREPVVETVAAPALEKGQAVAAGGSAAPGRELVGCGSAWLDVEIRIADPETGAPCEPGRVGEIQVAGPSIARGYWNRPEETESTFVPRAAGLGTFLRTGDLGFLRGSELFVTGRLKDLIILRGRNLYPQDVELSAERSHPSLRSGCGAAFSADAGGEERLVVVFEVERGSEGRTDEIAAAVRRAVAEEHDAQVYEIVLLPHGEVPKTSSGKIQRRACRARYLAGELPAVGRSALGAAETALEETEPEVGAAGAEGIEAWLRERLARAFGLPASAVAPDQPLTSLGIDSLSAVELQHALEAELGVEVGATELLEGPTVRELADRIAGRLGGGRQREADVPRATGAGTEELPLLHGQRALWLLQRLEPEGSAYNIAAAVRVGPELDVEALRRAWEILAARHEALRAAFPETADGPVQRFRPGGGPAFFVEPAEEWSEERLRERLHEGAHRPFDLQDDPLLRIGVFRLAGGGSAVLLVVHHIVADLWSLAVLVSELGVVLRALREGGEPRLEPLPLTYSEAVVRQLRRLEGEAGERLWDYWRERLGGELPVAELPADRPRPAVQGFRGGARSLEVDRALAGRLHGLGRDRRATFFTTLLAAFQVLLHRYSGQTDWIVGSPTAGRETPDLAGLVGYFVNPVALRTDLSGDPSFAGLVDRTRETVLAAFRHQDLPFPLLVERLQPQRDPSRSPLFQVMFVLQRVHLSEIRGLSAFALGTEGARVDLGGLALESMALERRAAQFDLELMAAETEHGLALTLIYDADLFDGVTVERALRHLEELARGATEWPAERISELSLLTGPEREQLAAWNATAAELPEGGARCFPELFEEAAARTPGAVAAEDAAASLTYAELNVRAEGLARILAEICGSPEEPVAVWADRDLDFLTAVLGILKAGNAYLPLDPRQPAPRLVRMLETSRCRIVLAGEGHLDACRSALAEGEFRQPVILPLRSSIREGLARPAPAPPHPRLSPDRLAYILFTSGSTGLPKGAMLEHRGMLNHLFAKIWDLGLGAGDCVAQTAAPTFDISVWQFLAVLLVGGRVRIVPDDVVADPVRLLREVEEQGVTILEVVPSLLRALLDEVEADPGSRPGLGSLRWLIPTGEALPPELARSWFAAYRQIPLVNAYGPTECSDDVTHQVLEEPPPEGAPRVPVGRPIANLRTYVVDRLLAALPVGVPGELCVAGIGVGRGYLGDPARTAAVFVPDPFSTEPGGRLYRTGDLGLRRPDGILDVLGRADHQVKVRGFRIELGEIEAALAAHPGVRETVVLARPGPRGDARLAAYWTARPEVPAGAADLREHLRQRLPEAMVPSAFVLLDALPLTANGKVDRKALPEPDWGGEAGPRPLAPRDEIEALVAGVFAEVLGVDRVGAAESFFEAGGHSLLATRVVSRLRRALGVDLPLRALFEEPTAAGLAARVRAAAVPPVALPPLRRFPPAARLSLSFAQQRLWFLAQLEPESPEYNMPGEVRLAGRLSVPALAASLAAAVRRHEALRTVFRSDEGEPWQEVLPELEAGLPLIDLSALPSAARECCARDLARAESRRPFDLASGPLLRAALVRLGGEEHRLLFTLHHIVSDGWSQGVLVREISALYRASTEGGAASLPELPVQYADFAQWQRQWLQGDALEAQLAWWRGALGREHPALELPLDRPRPPRRTHRGARRAVRVPRPPAGALDGLVRREGATAFMGLLASFQTLLHRFGGQSEVRVGTPIANRRWEEIEGLIGFFVNTLVLRGGFSGEPSFRDLLAQAREAALGAYAHQDVPFERLVDELQPVRDLSRTPLFQAMLILQNAPIEPLALAGLEIALEEIDNGTAKFELTLSLEETPDGLRGWLEYNADLFDGTTAERFIAGFLNLLEDGVARPDAPVSSLSPLGETARHQVLREWDDTAAAIPAEGCVHLLFEAWAAREPEAPAVAAGREVLTRRELNDRANRLAGHLRRMGVRTELPVGICTDRSVDLVVALLGVLKAGGSYVPLDPAFPRERLGVMLEDSGAKLVLTRSGLAGLLPEHGAREVLLDALDLASAASENPRGTALPDSLAYTLFTSGSTGRPKGVQIPHRALVNFLASMARLPGLAGEALLSVTTLSFDIAGLEIYLPLITGGRLVLADRETAADGARLAAELARSKATVMQATPATWRLLLDAGWEGSPGLTALCGGEALPRELARALLPRAGRLWNLYGPTETTIWSTVAAVGEGSGSVSIGRPIANTAVRVLDPWRQPVPVGVAGELSIGGAGVARGYAGRPDLTAERFVPDPAGAETGARLYRTGDLVRWLPDGRLEFLGRIDQQVKVRGFRIELEEIEAVLADHPAVARAAVAARGEGVDRRLVAWVIPAGTAAPDASELRSFVGARLPEYMVPSLFAALDAFPLTPNGKVDRRALPDPEPVSPGAAVQATGDPVEEVVAGILARVLGVEQVGAHASFFELGGHSLLATRAMARINEIFGVDLPLRRLFETPTAAGLARVLAEVRRNGGSAPPLQRIPRDRPLPASFGQERLWVMHHLAPESPVYNVFQALRFTGPLDDRLLEQSFEEVVRRHETLRTTFATVQGLPVQRVASPGPFPLRRIDLRDLGEGAREREVARLASAEARAPFDLRQGPLFRTTLLVLGEESRVLLLTMHHIICDDWSVGLLVREVAALYEALATDGTPAMSELPIQYADFAGWQREWLSGKVLEGKLAYWKEALGGELPVLRLPTDHPRPEVQSFRGASQPFVLPAETKAALRKLGLDEGVTLFMTLLAAFAAVLHRCSGQDDLVVGCPIAGRDHVDTESLIGLFVNILPLRLRFDGMASWRDLLLQVRRVALEAFDHRDVPFERLVEALQVRRDLSRAAIRQVGLAFQDASMRPVALPGGATARPIEIEAGHSRLDLTLFLWEEDGGGLAGVCEYSTDLFEGPTVARFLDLFRLVLEDLAAGAGRPLPALPPLIEREREERPRVPAAPALETNLTGGQLLFWFAGKIHGGEQLYFHTATTIFTLEGEIDGRHFERAFHKLLETCEILRCRIVEVNGLPWMTVKEDLLPPLEELDFSATTDPGGNAREWLAARCQVPMDLGDRLFDTALVKVAPRRFVWFFSVHHIICDGLSVQLLAQQLSDLYALSLRSELEKAQTMPSFAAYAAEERAVRESGHYRRAREYWERKLALPAPANLFYRKAGASPTTRTERVTLELSPAESEAVRRRTTETSLFSPAVVFGVTLFAYLHRLSGETRVRIGTPFANRTERFKGVVGLLMNACPLQVEIAPGETFSSLARKVQREIVESSRYQQYPVSNRPDERAWDVYLNYQSVAFQELCGVPVFFELVHSGRSNDNLDLQVSDFSATGRFRLDFDLNQGAFDAEQGAAAVRHYENILRSFLADGNVPLRDARLLSDAEAAQLVAGFNDTRRSYPRGICLHHLIEAQAERSPEAIAVSAEDRSLTYRELDDLAGVLAGFLAAEGVRPDSRVGVCMERSSHLLVALLGILKAGAAYVPLDPGYPAERIEYMREDSRVPVLLTQSHLAQRLPAGGAQRVCLDTEWARIAGRAAGGWPRPEVLEENAAYMIYTSGSTGRPKGVVVPHTGICNRLLWMQEAYGLTPADVVLQKTPFSFDVSVWELFWPLMFGARLVVARPGGHQDPAYLVSLIAREGVTTLHFVPSMLQIFLEQPGLEMCTGLRQVFCSGEALPEPLRIRFHERLCCELHNLYGPTEASVDVTYWPCPPVSGLSVVPIGKPIANTQIHLLDRDLNLVPLGIPGELHIGGIGLARGYFARPGLTAEKFIPDPFAAEPGARLYKTGDLARFLPDGNVEFLGRIDHQVKVRGFRIELGEIEAALAQQPGIREAVVVLREDRPGDRRLAAYFVAEEGARVAVADLRAACQVRLPEYMVPAAFVELDAMPLTPSGKVSRQALPTPAQETGAEEANHHPRTPLESLIAGICAEVLGVERVGIDANFFEIGGNSLMATQVVTMLQEVLPIELDLRKIFEGPTVAHLASVLEGEKRRLGEGELQLMEEILADFERGMSTGDQILEPS